MALLDGSGDPAHAPPPHPDLQPNSVLLQSFRSFLLSVYLNVVTFMQSQLECVDDRSEQLDLSDKVRALYYATCSLGQSAVL